MKWTTVILSICFFGGLMACNNDPNPAAGETASEASAETGEAMSDSSRAVFIDNYVDQISQNNQIDRKQYPLNFSGPKGAVFINRLDGDIVRGAVSLYLDDYESRTAYFEKGGKLVQVNHREWHKLENPHAIQYIAYFNENEKIFQVGKRYIKLESGEKPGGVVGEPLLDDMAQADSLTQVFKIDWERILKAVKSQ